MIGLVRTLAVAAALAIGSTAAMAQTSTPKQDKQDTSAMAAKKADCKRQARAQHFGIHWIKRSRFMDECMNRS
jgi:hypothetical protein